MYLYILLFVLVFLANRHFTSTLLKRVNIKVYNNNNTIIYNMQLFVKIMVSVFHQSECNLKDS